MPIDPFASVNDGLLAAARNPYAIVPSDTVELPLVPKAIYVGTGGHIVLRGIDGATDVTFANVPSGGIIDARASHVRATGTTASNLVALA